MPFIKTGIRLSEKNEKTYSSRFKALH